MEDESIAYRTSQRRREQNEVAEVEEMEQYKIIEQEALEYFGRYIDPRYNFVITIDEENIFIEISPSRDLGNYGLNPELINYFNYNNNNGVSHTAQGYIHAKWNSEAKTSILKTLKAGFWAPKPERPNPLQGVGLGKFLMIIYTWIIQKLGIETAELDNNTNEIINNITGLLKPSFYSKFNFERAENWPPDMVRKKIQKKCINCNAILEDIITNERFKNSPYWAWPIGEMSNQSDGEMVHMGGIVKKKEKVNVL